MSDSPNSRPHPPASSESSDEDLAAAADEGAGVLASLPRTRPQRLSARRAAARTRTSPEASRSREASRATPRKAADTPRVGKPPNASKTSARPASKRKPASVRSSATSRPSTRRASARRRTDEPAPRQGFEAEPDSLGGPVQPPGGADLVASAAELAGELAKTGVNAGARLVKDFLSRLPG